jgi:hypothetical protein
MINRSEQFDLGLDKSRIKDPRDAKRQETTVSTLLERMFPPNSDECRGIQILADEVGMGKTYVALGTAFSVLEAMRNGATEDDLRGCYQKVLIITPPNASLLSKWQREVGEFVKRCVKPEFRVQATQWFSATSVERVDDLVRELRRPGAASRVIVVSMDLFRGAKLRNYDVKRRHLLGIVFRYWGPRFNHQKRESLLKGAPAGWPGDSRGLEEFTDREQEQLLFDSEELLRGIRQLDVENGAVAKLLETCKQIAEPYVRGRNELFRKVEAQLNGLYRELMPWLINSSLPLVIVDEAHHWKNGPSEGTNGFRDFAELIACRTRRVMLLTATPFQLRPSEMLEILKIADHLQPCPTLAASQNRRDQMEFHRETVLRPVLNQAAAHGSRFAKAWSKLPRTVTTELIEAAWSSPSLTAARTRLDSVASLRGAAMANDIEQIIDTVSRDCDPDIRQLMREALRLYIYNSDLSYQLSKVVIRHRRPVGHRWFRVGREFERDAHDRHERPDRHVLHAAAGIDVRGDGELPHYILMRCVSEMKAGKGRSSVGSALTGCYSTLIDSAEGKAVKQRLSDSELGKVYLGLLMGMVNASQDPLHPKVRQVVDAVVENWKTGEKTLIFCFRTNTAKRLHEIIDERIRAELASRRERCMGGPESLKSLRSRLTGRDRDLVVLGLDRVLWSLMWIPAFRDLSTRPIVPEDLDILDTELRDLAEVGLRFGIDLSAERVDRVFLHRATERIIARRLLEEIRPTGLLRRVLEDISSEEWIAGPYGLHSSEEEADVGAEAAHFDERGVHTRYTETAEPASRDVDRVSEELRERRLRARRQGQIAVLDIYHQGPSLWLCAGPPTALANREANPRYSRPVLAIHEYLWELTTMPGELDWESRRSSMQAIRRAVLRESVLLRLLPEKHDRDDSGWGELLVHSFFAPLPGQQESMADRIAVFLEDLKAASGQITDKKSARYAMLDATRLQDQQFVALVSGSKEMTSRERVFSGFNTPLLPEVLVCTSVGQEGIDLHRHCRHVVHFDLAWNPAVMEQRTGRTDRIGSKTFRERSLGQVTAESFLEIGVPYLAGTYDERMYEELRLRAQTFEILTGGDLAADNAEGADDRENAEGQESNLRLLPLPKSLIEAMRVNLHVWSDDQKPSVDESQHAATDSHVVVASGLLAKGS